MQLMYFPSIQTLNIYEEEHVNVYVYDIKYLLKNKMKVLYKNNEEIDKFLKYMTIYLFQIIFKNYKRFK